MSQPAANDFSKVEYLCSHNTKTGTSYKIYAGYPKQGGYGHLAVFSIPSIALNHPDFKEVHAKMNYKLDEKLTRQYFET